MVKDSVAMVFDCGGGTVDITIHKLSCNPEEDFFVKSYFLHLELVNGDQNSLTSILRISSRYYLAKNSIKFIKRTQWHD